MIFLPVHAQYQRPLQTIIFFITNKFQELVPFSSCGEPFSTLAERFILDYRSFPPK
jgi:hypothetical protein